MNVLIIEDHPITAMGLKMIIEENFKNSFVEIAFNGKEALNIVKNTKFDIIILDISLPNTDTQALFHNLRRFIESAEILMYSNNDAKLYAMPFISMGASGYIHKSSSSEQMVSAIKMVMSGQIYISKDILQKSLGKEGNIVDQKSNLSNLFSRRELELYTHLLNGKRIKEISEIMNIHQSTASTLKKRVLLKSGAKSIIDLKQKADEQKFH